MVKSEDKPATTKSATVIKGSNGEERYRIVEDLPNKPITKTIEIKQSAPK